MEPPYLPLLYHTGHVVEPGDVRRSMLTPSQTVMSQDKTRHDAQREHNRVRLQLEWCPPQVLHSLSLQPRSVPETQRRMSRLLSRERRKRRRLAELGIDYDFSGYRGVSNAMVTTPTHTTFTCDDDVVESE